MTDDWVIDLARAAGIDEINGALVAVGGYGRAELSPGSDIDLYLIHDAGVDVSALADRLWYPIWDEGIKLGHAVRTVKETIALASDDLDTATAVLSVRFLAGDESLADQLREKGSAAWQKRSKRWLAELDERINQRHEQAGEVAFLLEPDLKEGRGGLRDHDMIRWALQVDRPDVTAALEDSFDDLAGPAELLLAARCELHRATGRATNTLQLQDQERVADAMGYADADVLMQNLAGAAHAIEWATERFWRRTERLIRSSGRATRRTHVSAVLSPGVVVVDDEAHIAADADVDEQSYVFRFAASAAHAGVPMGGRSLRMLASRGVPPGEEWTDATRRAFISLLGSGSAVMHTVESLERYGLFSRYLPEWRAVRSLPQRNAFHTYTVDRHLLQTVANATEFVRDVSRPDLLLLGALLHDLGKGYPGDHTEAGVVLVDTVSAALQACAPAVSR
jgi:[protein-PII] uridylyltransferase